MVRSLLAVVTLLAVIPAARAGMYSPDEPCAFQINPDGTAQPLPFRQFQMLYADRMAGFVPPDPAVPGTLDWRPIEDGSGFRAGAAGVVAQRVFARWPKARQLKGNDLAAHTVDLLHQNALGAAIELLQPESRSRSPNYLLLANLVHAHAARGDWDAALSMFAFALDCDPPAAFPGTTPERLKWQLGIDRRHYRLWLRLRKDEAVKKPPVITQEPDAVFEDADRKPIRFWEGEAEAAKLPPDAVAVAQQLALWSPADVKLLWTLGEVYLATGKVAEAKAVFESCADARKFGGPAVFRDHRAKALELFAELPHDYPLDEPATPSEPKKAFLPALADLVGETQLLIVGGAFAAAAVVLIGFQIRSFARRLGRRRPTP